MRRPLAAALLALVAACAPRSEASGTTGDECRPGSEDCPCAEDVCEEGLVCASGFCVDPEATSGEPSTSSTTGEDSSSSTSSTSEPSMTSSSTGDASTSWSTSSTSSTSSSSGSTTEAAPVCGDNYFDPDTEECDDGNLDPGDGCSPTCTWEAWSHVGVAHDVGVAELHGWEPCWTDTYEAGDLVADVLDACPGDHLLLGCRPVGSAVLTLAAHGPREAVTAEVNYDAQERSTANGVDFFWAPYYGVIGFGPVGQAYCYDGEGAGPSNLCWRADSESLLIGVRCGAEADILGFTKPMAWERVLFQAWN